MSGLSPLSIIDEASVSLVREEVRRQGAALALPTDVVESMATVVSELAHNQLAHGRRGSVAVSSITRAGVAGLEIVAVDRGVGISDPRAALRGRDAAQSVSAGMRTSLGIGVAGARELSDEMDFDIRLGEGTCVRARKFATKLPREREVGIYGRPCEGERVSGDHGVFTRAEGSLVAALADGLGHGPPAREAAHASIHAAMDGAEGALEHRLSIAHAAAAGTRGAAVAMAAIDDARAEVSCASVGNVTVQIARIRQTHRFGGSSATIGSAGALPRIRVERLPLEPRDVLVMFSDGVSAKASIEQDFALLREPPIVIAQTILERFARAHDDALVLVVR